MRQINPSKCHFVIPNPHNDSIIPLLDQQHSTWSQDILWPQFDCGEKQAQNDGPVLTTMLANINLRLFLWSYLSKKRLGPKLWHGLRKLHVPKTKANTLSCYLGKNITWKSPCVDVVAMHVCVFLGRWLSLLHEMTHMLWRLVIVGAGVRGLHSEWALYIMEGKGKRESNGIKYLAIIQAHSTTLRFISQLTMKCAAIKCGQV